MSLGQEELELVGCKELIELSAKGATRREIGQAVENIRSIVVRQVKGQCAIFNSIPDTSTSHEDIVQDVLIKMIEHPPNRECESGKERVTVMAWVKTTARNIIVDKVRRAQVRGKRIQDDASAANLQPDPAPQSGEVFLRRLEASQKVKKLKEYLSKYYPKGIEYLRAVQLNQDASGYELAEAMGVSRANLDQIARRTRIWAVRFQELSASEGEQG